MLLIRELQPRIKKGFQEFFCLKTFMYQRVQLFLLKQVSLHGLAVLALKNWRDGSLGLALRVQQQVVCSLAPVWTRSVLGR